MTGAGLSRRTVAKLAMGAIAGALAGTRAAPISIGQARARIVIVGGGAGGARCARAIKAAAPGLDVVLIEQQPLYTTCFRSNHYIGGLTPIEALTFAYDMLVASGIRVVVARADRIDPRAKIVTLADGATIPYDRLVLSPGIDFVSQSVPGWSPAVAARMPHAFGGAAQLQILRSQLVAMPDGGVVVVAPPLGPYRCPPAPYERVSLIAHYLKAHKPRAKIIILDPKNAFSKQALFQAGWQAYYPGMIDLHLSNEIDSFAITSLDTATMEIQTDAGLTVRGDVINVIPGMRAGAIAQETGCTDGAWCPIDPATLLSARVRDVHVIGDAAMAGDMPKSAFSASSQALRVAHAIAADFTAAQQPRTKLRNTCWSLIAPGDSVKLGADYEPVDGRLTASGGFVSQVGESAEIRSENSRDATRWYEGLTKDMFAAG